MDLLNAKELADRVAESKKTGWISTRKKPMREGYYETRWSKMESITTKYFDGKEWTFLGKTSAFATSKRGQWRGLKKEAYEALQ